MISKKIRKLRENNGFTQKQVADAISVERSTYAYYETGKTTPDIDTIIQLAKIFNVNFTDILEDEIRTSIGSFYDSSDEKHSFYDKPPEKKESIYDLKKDEKTLLCYYRALSENDKDKFLNNISKYFDKHNKKKE